MSTMDGEKPIPDRIYFRIRDVAEILDVKPYVLRYWETEFPIISPEKSKTGQRVYKKNDIENLLLIKHLLYKERYSIEGARKKIRELKKEGELVTFKSENVLPKASPEETERNQLRLGRALELSSELQRIASIPISDIFRL